MKARRGMRGGRLVLPRLILCVVAPAGVTIATWLVIVQIAVNPLTLLIYVLPMLILGLCAWLGRELALHRRAASGSLGLRRLVVWIGAAALFSAVYGELAVQVAEQPFVRPGPDLIPPGTTVSATLMLALIAVIALTAVWLAGEARLTAVERAIARLRGEHLETPRGQDHHSITKRIEQCENGWALIREFDPSHGDMSDLREAARLHENKLLRDVRTLHRDFDELLQDIQRLRTGPHLTIIADAVGAELATVEEQWIAVIDATFHALRDELPAVCARLAQMGYSCQHRN